MTAKADGSVKAGVWVLDNAGGSWHAANSGGATDATYQYQSSIRCDGSLQPNEPAIAWLIDPKTKPPAKKFLAGPKGQMLDTWPCSFTGPLGSVGKTQADGNSYVDDSRWNERYVCDISVSAYAKPAADQAASAVAKSWASDPWTFRLRPMTKPGRSALVGITLRLKGRFSGIGGGSGRADAVRMRGDMGSLDIVAPGPSGKPACTARLAPGWKVYANVPVLRPGKSMKIPKALTAKQVSDLLTKSLAAAGPALRFGANLTFVKDLGSKGGSFDCGLSIMAAEAGAGEGGRISAPGWEKTQDRRRARR